MGSRADNGRLVALGHDYLSQGQADRAYETLLQVRGAGGKSRALYAGLGKAAMALRDATSAEKWWGEALRTNPSSAECHLGLGTARYHLGKVARAIASYQCALDIDPMMEGARVSLAVAYLAADCPAQALFHAKDHLSRSPENIDLRLVRASALIKLNRAAEAIPDLVWLHGMGARLAEVGLLESKVHCALGDHEAALVLAAEICEAFPTLAAPLRVFRETFEEYVARAPTGRVNEFLGGLGLPLQGTRLAMFESGRTAAAKQPVIDVVIPVHDGLDCLKACLESLEDHRSPILGRIILVDDRSSREVRLWLQEIGRGRRDMRVVHTRKPSGFSRSLALGLSKSRADAFVALNSDCVVSAGWLERLSAAMPPDGRVAMVGPLSNNAAWQSMGDILDPSGNYASHPMPSVDDIARTQHRLGLIRVFGAPDTALIHGFCVLVDRQIYDALGGLDLNMFPNGYGEFQDLSLRALDGGYDLRIATDCFVAHAGGASISDRQRAELSREARRLLYQRYTALRYLSAECSAATNRQVTFTRRRFTALATYCPGELDAIVAPAEMTVFGDAGTDLAGRRVCIFVSFAPDGRVLPYTLHYLSELKAQGFEIVLVLNVEGAHHPPAEVQGLARLLIIRDNIGFDFGAWRDALARFPTIWDADMLVFTNDSIIGPFKGFDRIIKRIEDTTASLFYLTESEFAQSHFQSFFWGLKGPGLKDPVAREFLASIKDFSSKAAAIFLYEVFLRHACETLAGMDSFCFFPFTELSGVDHSIRPTFNPTHHLWRELLQAGFPFLKADFCRKNATSRDAEIWLKEIDACGGDGLLARLHVEATRVQRAVR